MKLSQLRYFLAVCRYGSFSSASKAMFVSQPAISQAIRELESDYNVVLFYRNNNHLEITDDGKWLQQKAETLLRLADDLHKDLSERAESRLVVKLGVAPMAGNLYFYPAINDLRKHLPNIVPDVREAGSLEIRRWLDTGTIDLGFCLLDCIDLDKVSYYKVRDIELKLCVHKSHPLARQKTVTFAQLARHQICMLGEDSFQHILLKHKYEEAGIKPNVLMYSSQLSSVFTLLSYGNCAAFMFDGFATGDQYVMLSMAEPIMLSLGMIWDGKSQDYSNVNTVRKHFVQIFKKQNGGGN